MDTNILNWLGKSDYEYVWNFKIGARTPDIIAFKDNEIIAFDFKKHENEISIKNCLCYLHKVNKVYVVLPSKDMKTSLFKIFKENGIGLITINENIKVILEAKFFYHKNEFLIKKLKKRSLKNIYFQRGYEKENILKTLEEHPEGLTIKALSEIIGAHRQTITKYVLILEKDGKIYRRRIGSAVLNYAKEKFYEILENKKGFDKT